MERELIRKLYGKNFIGPEELRPFFEALGWPGAVIEDTPMDYNDEDLNAAADDGYILILGVDKLSEHPITLRTFRDTFGMDPDESEPCLYNQDWYLKEAFVDKALTPRWYLIKKDVFEDTRAIMPVDLINRGINFPSAILCAYTFFAYYFYNKEYLWWHDFVWCSDVDHNGDRIYVGKYHDIDGVNKNGFSIHRHLALRPCYGSVNVG